MFSVHSSLGQNLNFAWVKHFPGTSTSGGQEIAIDAAGNIYSTGSFTGTHDFDPGPGVYNLTQPSGNGVYISKLDPNGNFIWAKQFTTWNAKPYSITVDPAGNVYTTGFYQQVADFDPGPGVFNLNTFSTGSDVFVSKLDNNGNFIWAKRLGGNGNFYSEGHCVQVDQSGNVYTTGIFNGTLDFDPGPSTFSITSFGLEDMFVSKLDVNGDFVWAKRVGGTSYDYGQSLVIDNSGNTFVTGTFASTADFDPGPAVYNVTAFGSADIFVLKLDPSGNFAWVKQIGGALDENSYSIVLDPSGNIYTTGYFRSTTDFDPGPANYSLTPNGNIDIFLSKLDNTGNFLWAKAFGGPGYDRGFSVINDPSGNIYLTGDFQNTVDVDPGPAILNFTSNGGSDVFVVKFDASGNLIWAKQWGGVQDDYGFSICVNAANDVYTTGSFNATVDFDPGTDVYQLTASVSMNAFVHKLSRCNNISQTTLDITTCTSYTLNNQTFTTAGTYIQVLQNSLGCDSIITLNLAFKSTNDTITISACNTYIWNGITYSASGFYRDTLTNIFLCDSIINLDLTIRTSITTTTNAIICEGESFEGFTTSGVFVNTFMAANGCDSTRTLNLTVQQRSYSSLAATICQGENYFGYSSTGTYKDTLVAANGCDSIRTIQLLVNPQKLTTINMAICEGQSYFVAGASQTLPGIYKDTLLTWLGCDSVIVTSLIVNPNPNPYLGADKDLCQGQSITFSPGSFNSYQWQDQSILPSFTTSTTGIYWVQVTDANNCTNRDTVEIKNIYSPPSNFLKQTDSLCQYDKITIGTSVNYLQYSWSTGSSQPNIIVDHAGQFILTVKDANNCTGKDTIQVIQKLCNTGVFVPTAFTPNGNGLNDVFRARVYGIAEYFKLEVFDRWGNRVFMATDPMQAWDGKFNGAYLTSAVFVWQCSYKIRGEKHGFQKGTVTLIR